MKLKGLDFKELDVRKKFIQETDSGLYGGTTVDGKKVVVLINKGEGMTVKTLNTKGWYEGYTYDSEGHAEDEVLEKA